MKYSEIKKLPRDDLDKKLSEVRIELMKLNAQVAIGTTPKSTKQIRELKKTLAKAQTLMSERLAKGVEELKTNVRKPKTYFHH
jgi:ribosomal protein L29